VTRVLYWNIENFALNKIAHPNTKKRKSGSSVSMSDAAQDRRNFIQQVITAAAPDIIVIIEVETGFDGAGQIARGAGLDGCLDLCNAIRGLFPANPDVWMLVPPIQTGPNEAVGVFYNSTNRFFAGPNVWPGGDGPAAAPGTGTGAYPLVHVLPTTAVPPGALQNVGVAQDVCAARINFTFAASNAQQAGQAVDFGFIRAPYMVSFAETDANGVVQRNLTLFAIHSPAAIWLAEPFLRIDIPGFAEIVDNLAANEVRVIVGDFNVNLMHQDLTPSTAYTTLQATGNYDLALRPLAPPPPTPFEGYPWYYGTHIRGQYTASCWSAADTAYYPGYGYMGADTLRNAYAIDNIFTRYGAGLNPPAANNVTILNGIVGSPYTVVAPPSGGAPPGTYAMPRQVRKPPPPPPANAPAQGPPFSIGLLSFNAWDNYGLVRSASDHLPIVIDV